MSSKESLITDIAITVAGRDVIRFDLGDIVIFAALVVLFLAGLNWLMRAPRPVAAGGLDVPARRRSRPERSRADRSRAVRHGDCAWVRTPDSDRPPFARWVCGTCGQASYTMDEDAPHECRDPE